MGNNKLLSSLIEKVKRCIENHKRISISMEKDSTHFTDSFIPDTIEIDDGIYIEGELAILSIEGNFDITYDDYDEMYILTQYGIIYYLTC